MSVPDTSELLADSIAREEALRELISRRDAQLKTQRLDQVEIEVRLDALFRENIEQEQEIADLNREIAGLKNNPPFTIYPKDAPPSQVIPIENPPSWWSRLDNWIKRLAK